MKEIEFRGFSKEHNQFVYGYYIKCRNHHYILQKYNGGGYDERWETSDWVEVDEKSVGQYTGLKDKNGKEIYEGDVLRVFEDGEWDVDNKTASYEVIWGGESNYPAFCLKDYEDLEYNSLQHATEVVSCEIIGNIYETPELLTDK